MTNLWRTLTQVFQLLTHDGGLTSTANKLLDLLEPLEEEVYPSVAPHTTTQSVISHLAILKREVNQLGDTEKRLLFILLLTAITPRLLDPLVKEIKRRKHNDPSTIQR